jgi:GWxTD domain-containing protein
MATIRSTVQRAVTPNFFLGLLTAYIVRSVYYAADLTVYFVGIVVARLRTHPPTRKSYRTATAFLANACLLLTAFGQGQQNERPAPPLEEPGEQFIFFETINLLADDRTKSRIDVPYRVEEGFFVAVKNSDPALAFPFKRRGEVLVELLDAKGNSRARTINHLELGAHSTEPKPEVKSWYEGIASFIVEPGEYSVVFELDDLESKRHYLNRNRTITAKKFDGPSLETSTPFFVASGTAEHLVPINFGGNLAFGKGAALFVQLFSINLSSAPVRVEYSIATQKFMFQEPTVLFTDTLPQLALLPKGHITLTKHAETLRYTTTSFESHQTGTLLIPLNAERFPLRPMTITLTLRQGDLTTTIEHPFKMIWPEMPFSLHDIDLALDALRHITREAELDSLQSGTRDERLKHLEEFWKAKDRTPETTYNEMMVEYYRRVDYTMRMFNSMRGFDGYKSDRGRIYILHGPPTRSERTLDPTAGYKEVWIYESKNKKFTFVDQSKSGNYTLVSSQNL